MSEYRLSEESVTKSLCRTMLSSRTAVCVALRVPKSLNSAPDSPKSSSQYLALRRRGGDEYIVRAGNNTRRIGSILIIAALLAPSLALLGIAPVPARAATQVIVFDMGHGQYKAAVFTAQDAWLAGNLTALGYQVIWAWGGINASILSNATGLVLGSLYGPSYNFSTAMVNDITTWFNSGKKFLWVAGDSDNAGNGPIANASVVLDAVGSHVYVEPCSVEDPISSAGSAYRVVANKTSTNAYVADLVGNTTKVLMHGPTTLYGSTTGHKDGGIVSLENTTIANVYPVLYYGGSAVIVDPDLIPPVAHTAGQTGSFTAMTVEVNAGSGQNGVIAVSGASPYADYMPMTCQLYYNVTMNGQLLVRQTIDWGMKLATYTTVTPVDYTLYIGIGAVAVVVVLALAFFLRKK